MLAAAWVPLTACASNSSSHAPYTPTAAIRRPSTVPPTSSTTTVTETESTSSPCLFADLVISAGQTGLGLGHVGTTIVFRNVATHACRMTGYPTVAGLDPRGQQATEARQTPNGYLGGLPVGTTVPPMVVLRPGQSASALVEGTNNPVGTATSCVSYPRLLVAPPGQTEDTAVEVSMPGCSGLEVHPVVAGTARSAT